MGGKTLSRRQSRRKAFELLFELEHRTGMTPQEILARTFEDEAVTELHVRDVDEDGYVSGKIDANARRFITELIEAVAAHSKELDSELSKYPEEWSYERIGTAERLLLRLALAEMAYLGTSHKVVINEALDMAKMYAQDDASKFLNGILGAVVRELDKFKEAHQGDGD